MRHATQFLLSCSALLLAACGTTQTADLPDDAASSSASSTAVSALPEGTFTLDPSGMPSGTAYVRGYPMVEQVQEPFCETDCQTHDYVFLAVTETNSTPLTRFLKENAGNTYAGPARIGLGCVKDETITYWNDSDARGRAEVRLDPSLSRTILNATAENPVSLTLTKLPLQGGAGAPACYAHFTEVSLFTPSSLPADTEPAGASTGQTADRPCRPSGCSGQLCTDEEVMSTCEFKAEYACYKAAVCERQASGECGWTMTEELIACLQDPPPQER